MFFDNYKQHTDAQIRQSLFWEYDMSRFDWEKTVSYTHLTLPTKA